MQESAASVRCTWMHCLLSCHTARIMICTCHKMTCTHAELLHRHKTAQGVRLCGLASTGAPVLTAHYVDIHCSSFITQSEGCAMADQQSGSGVRMHDDTTTAQ
jgi:hypothetical protein